MKIRRSVPVWCVLVTIFCIWLLAAPLSLNWPFSFAATGIQMDGSASVTFASASGVLQSVTLTTTLSPDVIIVFITADAGGNVNGPSNINDTAGSNLTWHLRKHITAGAIYSSEYYANASSTLSSDVIHLKLAASANGFLTAFGISGARTTTASFDSSFSPYTATCSSSCGTAAVTGISTSNAKDFVFGLTGVISGGTITKNPSNSTLIKSGIGGSQVGGLANNVTTSATFTGHTIGVTTSGSTYVSIVDAVMALATSSYTSSLSFTASNTVSVTSTASLTRSFSTTISPTSTLSALNSFIRGFSNLVTITSSLARTLTLIRSFTYTVSISAVLSKTLLAIRSSSITVLISTSISHALAITLSNTIVISSSVTKVLGYVRSSVSTITISAVLATASSFIRSFSNTITISSSLTHVSSLIRSFSLTVVVASSLTNISHFIRQFSSNTFITTAFPCPNVFNLDPSVYVNGVQLTQYNTYLRFPAKIYTNGWTINQNYVNFTQASFGHCLSAPQNFGIGSQGSNYTLSVINSTAVAGNVSNFVGSSTKNYVFFHYTPSSVPVPANTQVVVGTTPYIASQYISNFATWQNTPAPAIYQNTTGNFLEVNVTSANTLVGFNSQVQLGNLITISITSLLTRLAILARSFTLLVTISPVLSHILSALRSSLSTVTLGVVLTSVYNAIRSLTVTGLLSSSISEILVFGRFVTASISTLLALSHVSSFLRNLSDTVTIGISLLHSFFAVLFGSMSIVSSLTKHLTVLRIFNITVTITSAIARTLILARSLASNITISMVLVHASMFARSLSSSISIMASILHHLVFNLRYVMFNFVDFHGVYIHGNTTSTVTTQSTQYVSTGGGSSQSWTILMVLGAIAGIMIVSVLGLRRRRY